MKSLFPLSSNIWQPRNDDPRGKVQAFADRLQQLIQFRDEDVANLQFESLKAQEPLNEIEFGDLFGEGIAGIPTGITGCLGDRYIVALAPILKIKSDIAIRTSSIAPAPHRLELLRDMK